MMLQYSISQLLIRIKISTTIYLEKGWYKDKLNTEYFSMNIYIL